MGEIKVFVGNVSFQANKEDLEEFFQECKGMSEVAVIMDRDTGRSKGYAFIMFSTVEEAEEAVGRMDGKNFKSRPLKVKLANNQENNRSFKDFRPRERYQNYDRGGHSGGYGDMGQGGYSQGGAYGQEYGGGYGPGHNNRYGNGYGSYGGGGYGGGGYGGGDYGGGYYGRGGERQGYPNNQYGGYNQY